MKLVVVIIAVLSVLLCDFNKVAAGKIHGHMPGICLQPPPRSEGLCTIDIEGFYYDPRTNDCHQYEVGGCRAIPGQSFGSRNDCLATCVYHTRRIQDLRVIEK